MNKLKTHERCQIGHSKIYTIFTRFEIIDMHVSHFPDLPMQKTQSINKPLKKVFEDINLKRGFLLSCWKDF